jgi:23S rRNA (adenine1618-N6)-methyltransferase
MKARGGSELLEVPLSQEFANQCQWFTTLVSKSDNLKPLMKLLRKSGARAIKEIPMHQGHKITRLLAWSFIAS